MSLDSSAFLSCLGLLGPKVGLGHLTLPWKREPASVSPNC